jgi:hypothetical protein
MACSDALAWGGGAMVAEVGGRARVLGRRASVLESPLGRPCPSLYGLPGRPAPPPLAQTE